MDTISLGEFNQLRFIDKFHYLRKNCQLLGTMMRDETGLLKLYSNGNFFIETASDFQTEKITYLKSFNSTKSLSKFTDRIILEEYRSEPVAAEVDFKL